MKHLFIISALAMFMVALPFAAAGGESEFLLHGRVSMDTGTLLVKNASEAEWSAAAVNTLVMAGDHLWVDQSGTAELELSGGSFLRFADGSRAEMVSLPPSAYIRGWVGSFYVQRLTRSQGDFILVTPAATLDIAADSMARVDIDASGATTVSTRWGSVAVRTDQGGDVIATEGFRVWVDPGLLPSEATPFDRTSNDAFDTWNNDRARLLAEGLRTMPKEVIVRETTVGVYDLPRYGEWVYIDRRPYWRPTVVVDYVPYRHGYWNYVPAVGHVWVDEYPFAYVTSHYGRWRHTVSYGWVWSYDPVWSPAWVASVRVGDYYAWAPVDYYHRPVVVTSSATFLVGGVSFCSVSTSYTRTSYLYAGPTYVYAPTTVVINNFTAAPPREVNVWHITPDARRRPSVPFAQGAVGGTRDYSPNRSIRGLQGDAAKVVTPDARARRLETDFGRRDFSPVAKAPDTGRAVRTVATDNARTTSPRQVRLTQTEQTYLTRGAAKEGGAAERTALVPESARLNRTSRETPSTRGAGTVREPQGASSGVPAERSAPFSRTATARNKDDVRSPAPTSTAGEGPATRASGRSDSAAARAATPQTPAPSRVESPVQSNRSVALRDMESAAPAPQRTTPNRSRIDQGAPRPGDANKTPAPQQSSTRGSIAPAPAPTIRQESAVQRAPQSPAKSPSVTTPRPDVRAPLTTTPSASPRQERAPAITRPTQQPAPQQPAPGRDRSLSPSTRPDPQPTPAPRQSIPTVRQESAPSSPRIPTIAPAPKGSPSPAQRPSVVSPPASRGGSVRPSAPQQRQAPTLPGRGGSVRGR